MGLDWLLGKILVVKSGMTSRKAEFFPGKLGFNEHLVEFCWMMSPAGFSYVSP